MKHTPLIVLGMFLVTIFALGVVDKLGIWLSPFPCADNCVEVAGVHANQSMAAAAWIIGIASTGLLFAAAIYAKSAAEAGHKSVAETRRIGEAQARAYLSIVDLKVDFADGGVMPFVVLSLRNSGQSPARKVEAVLKFMLHTDTRVVEKQGPMWFPDVPGQTDSTSSPRTGIGDISFAPSDFDNWYRGMHVEIVVYADDVFGQEVTAFGKFGIGWPEGDRRAVAIVNDFSNIYAGDVEAIYVREFRRRLVKRAKR